MIIRNQRLPVQNVAPLERFILAYLPSEVRRVLAARGVAPAEVIASSNVASPTIRTFTPPTVLEEERLTSAATTKFSPSG